MSANALKQPGSAMITKADIAYRLLYSAYERKLFNVLMTFAATLLMGISANKHTDTLGIQYFGGCGIGFCGINGISKNKTWS